MGIAHQRMAGNHRNGMNRRKAVGGYRIAPSPMTNGPASSNGRYGVPVSSSRCAASMCHR